MTQIRQPFPRRIPFVEHLGFELWGFGGGEAELRLDLADTHLNYWDVAHGGVLMTLLDVAMAHAARSGGVAVDAAPGLPEGAVEKEPGVATIEMKTSFMRPAEGRLRAAGKLLHRTATLAFCEGSVFDEAGRLCAQATATFKVLRALPRPDRHAPRPAPAAPTTDEKESP